MQAKIITINTEAIDEQKIKEAGEILQQGGLVAFPTETVYGLGGNALDAKASEKIYQAKGRPSDNPLIVHIADLEHLAPIVTEIPEEAKLLAQKFWPGPLTMIFKKSVLVPVETTGGLDSVAVRMPSHPVALSLIRAAGGYIAAPSANRSGRPSPSTAAHVIEDLGDTIDLIIDGGMVEIGLESTIVDFTEEIPTILRPGYVTEDMIRECIGEVQTDRGLLREDSEVKPKAPGMKYRHYAPKAPLAIVKGEPEAVASYINTCVGIAKAMGMQTGIIASDESLSKYMGGTVRSIGARADEESIALHLYEVLREFDTMNVAQIYSEAFDTPRLGQAIMNRLLKAAGHTVIEV